MPRKRDDGRGRLGGRAKGTPNKATSTIRAWIVEVINENRKAFAADIASLSGPQRLEVLGMLLKFVLPQNPQADEVEGAAYDIGNAGIVGSDMFGNDQYGVRKWYEPRHGKQWDKDHRKEYVGTDPNFEGYGPETVEEIDEDEQEEEGE